MRRAVAVAAVAAAAATALLPATARARAPATAPAAAGDRVLVLLVPDLRWSDVASMPTLQSVMRRGSVGVLSVRAQGEVTRCGDGMLELSAMTRVPTGITSCVVAGGVVSSARERYRHNAYGAHVGLLGDLLGGRVAALDAAAATAVARSNGSTSWQPSAGAAFAAGASVVVAADEELDLATHADRVARAAATDAHLRDLIQQVPVATTLLVAGSSDGLRGGAHLHPIVIAGPRWPHRELTSPSAGRPPFVQLFDVGPTLLAMQGLTDLPSSVSGRPIGASGRAVRGLSSYVDVDRHARRALHVGHPTFTVLCSVLLVCLLLLAAGRREAAWVARLVVGAPLAVQLVQLLPWWRWATVVYALILLALALAAGIAWRAVPAVTALVLLVDQLVGAPLQMSGPLGDNPLVAGRFHGMGNIAFGLAMGSLVLCAGATRRWGAAAALVLVGVVVDGAPMLGDDLGGVVALVAAGLVLVALLAGVRMGVAGAAAAATAAAVAAFGVAALDYTRPADQQTHAGRFVGQLLHGGAARVLHRKLDAVVTSFVNPAVTAVVVACLVALVVLLRRGCRRGGLPAALVASEVLGMIGTVTNDSGVFVAAAVALAVAPSAVLATLGDTRAL